MFKSKKRQIDELRNMVCGDCFWGDENGVYRLSAIKQLDILDKRLDAIANYLNIEFSETRSIPSKIIAEKRRKKK